MFCPQLSAAESTISSSVLSGPRCTFLSGASGLLLAAFSLRSPINTHAITDLKICKIYNFNSTLWHTKINATPHCFDVSLPLSTCSAMLLQMVSCDEALGAIFSLRGFSRSGCFLSHSPSLALAFVSHVSLSFSICPWYRTLLRNLVCRTNTTHNCMYPC